MIEQIRASRQGQFLCHGIAAALLASALWLAFALQALAAPYAAYVMDARTGETLYSENAETRLHPASLTKMMTLYITFQEIEAGRISLDTMVTVSKNAAAQPTVVIPETRRAATSAANADATTPASVTSGIAITMPQTSGVSR